ncbi:Sulfate transporter 1.1 [Acorus calamus]|uniref:Sulfate transporter 1.1 n=1 Tax=Acorus calamus TaxID=4465 RepID=A0AAV9F099_ACOCL|nr:Sulfate transporter 1.1 [Acorus calamus]
MSILSFLIDFLSHAAIGGFMGGAAITIALQQLKGNHFHPGIADGGGGGGGGGGKESKMCRCPEYDELRSGQKRESKLYS